jgi:hypothetical protein
MDHDVNGIDEKEPDGNDEKISGIKTWMCPFTVNNPTGKLCQKTDDEQPNEHGGQKLDDDPFGKAFGVGEFLVEPKNHFSDCQPCRIPNQGIQRIRKSKPPIKFYIGVGQIIIESTDKGDKYQKKWNIRIIR